MTALILIGVLLMIVGGIWLLIVTFQTSVPWGIFSLIFPVVGLVFVVMHWDVSKKPFLYQLAGVALAVVGFMGNPAFKQQLGG